MFYIKTVLAKNKNKIQQCLIQLIENYQNKENDESLISNYIAKQFEHLVSKLSDSDKVSIIKSEFNALRQDLKSKLLSFQVDEQKENDEEIVLSDFGKSFLSVSQIQILKVYQWIVTEDNLMRMEAQKISSESFSYSLSKTETVQFRLTLAMGRIDGASAVKPLFILDHVPVLSVSGWYRWQVSEQAHSIFGGYREFEGWQSNHGSNDIGFVHSKIKDTNEIIFEFMLGLA